MTAELIQFETHRDFRRSELYRQQPVPRAPSQGASLCSPVELQVARISRLLSELEELTREPDEVPSATLNQARLGLERARRVIRPWMAFDEVEGDPQPEVDDERLERMYRDLNRDA
jgi:hypothetical protein